MSANVAIGISCGILILGFVIGGWLLVRWARKKDAEARRLAASKTEDEIKVETAEVLAEEAARSDEEAWDEFNKNYPRGDSPR